MTSPAKPKRLRRWLASGAAAFAAYLLTLNGGCSTPLKVDPLKPAPATPVVDAQLELARTYAPFVYQGVHPEVWRQDLPTCVDFDGNLRGDDNWDHFAHYELPPTIYYAALESETHHFLSYHVFHPRDWSYMRVGVHATHENDGENLQVVVDKATGKVVLLFTQAHYFGGVYTNGDTGIGDGDECVRGPMLLLNDEGAPDPNGKHAGVFVEAFGHGIYGALHDDSVVVAADGAATFDCDGLVFRPAALGEAVREPATYLPGAVHAYQLESTRAKLLPKLLDGSLVGEGGLIDGVATLEAPYPIVDVPCYYEADRFSGPFGPDRGISPFALDFSFSAGVVGALFFDPARRYRDTLTLPEPWSLTYLNPYLPQQASSQ